MLSTIQKWGNSLALRIPKTFADEIGLTSNSQVEICVVGGEIHIVPVRETQYSLDELLNGITAENLHGEVDTGAALGNEMPL